MPLIVIFKLTLPVQISFIVSLIKHYPNSALGDLRGRNLYLQTTSMKESFVSEDFVPVMFRQLGEYS